MTESIKRVIRLVRSVNKFCNRNCRILITGTYNHQIAYEILRDFSSCHVPSNFDGLKPQSFERVLLMDIVQFMNPIDFTPVSNLIFKGNLVIAIVPNKWWLGKKEPGAAFTRNSIRQLFETQGFDVTQCDFIGAPMFDKDEVTNRFKAKEILVVARKNFGEWDTSSAAKYKV